jgi:hypothetical protein
MEIFFYKSFSRSFFLFFLMAEISGLTFGLAPAGAKDLTDRELSDLVQRAYIYSFPVYEMVRTRYMAVYNPANPGRTALNRFVHARKLADSTARAVTTPNNDTLFSSAWLDLSKQPLVLSVPDTAGRYYSMAFMDFYTNNFAYVGRRVTGTQAGRYLVVGPNWSGKVPPGMPMIKAPTNSVWLLGRTLVDNEEDLPNVYRIQAQYTLTPLSVWTKKEAAGNPPKAKNPPPAPDPKDPWQFFRIINLALTENPPPADEAPFMAELAQIGLGPNQTFDPVRFSEAQRQVILRAMKEAAQGIRTGFSQTSRVRQGWAYPPPNLGNYGKAYPLRAVVALKGLAALERAEAFYLTALTDKEGRPLDSENHYRLHFDKGQLPPVKAFWSISMYEVTPEKRAFFADNPIHRYSIGDRTKGLKFNPDGSLDILMQRQPPGRELESNWLPVPAGVFRVTFRAYQPGPAILDGTYVLPGIERRDQ